MCARVPLLQYKFRVLTSTGMGKWINEKSCQATKRRVELVGYLDIWLAQLGDAAVDPHLRRLGVWQGNPGSFSTPRLVGASPSSDGVSVQSYALQFRMSRETVAQR